MNAVQRCIACGSTFETRDPRATCGSCGGLLSLEQPAPPATGAALRKIFDDRRGANRLPAASGVWRFGEIVLGEALDQAVTQPEGNTPLVARDTVSRWAGVDGLLLKHEGHNPTGSFKDRGMTVAVTQARRLGAEAVACATTGNTGASMASYGAAAGIPALVVVPKDGVAIGKLAQVLAYGGRAVLVRGDFDACLRLVVEASNELGVYLLNSINPFRLEGQKTIVLELLQQLEWSAPDWIVLPAGNLGNTAAFGKAIQEACEWGLISRAPRLAAIQADGAAPFVRGFETGFRDRQTVRAKTVATAIQIGNPASWDRAVEAIRDTNGIVTSVPDEQILEAKAIIDGSGVGCEPASAASVAGVRKLVQDGIIARSDRVVAVLTGHLLKDPSIVTWYHTEATPPRPHANRPVEIEPRISELTRIVREEGRGKREE